MANEFDGFDPNDTREWLRTMAKADQIRAMLADSFLQIAEAGPNGPKVLKDIAESLHSPEGLRAQDDATLRYVGMLAMLGLQIAMDDAVEGRRSDSESGDTAEEA
jgi:hypothetical protein